MEFHLACGREVDLKGLHLFATYGGLIEGVPDAEMNDDLVQRAIKNAEELWGVQVHLIKPSVHWVKIRSRKISKAPFLPRYRIYARLFSLLAESRLTVVWFAGPEFFLEPLSDAIFKAIRDLPWDDLAEPCDVFGF